MRNSWSFPDANACLATLAQQLQSLGESPGVFEEHRRLRESESQTQKCLCKLFPFLAAPVCCSECAISCIVPLISVFVHVAATNCSSSYFKKCLIASEWQPHPRRGIWTFQGIDQFVFIFVFSCYKFCCFCPDLPFGHRAVFFSWALSCCDIYYSHLNLPQEESQG